MPRARSPDRNRAYEIFKEHNGKIENRRIAEMLEISEKTVGGWKCKDKWNQKLNGVLQTDKRSTPKRKRGGQPGNKNAVGAGGTGPPGNRNAEKHGFFSRHLPEETFSIIEEISVKDPLDILWENIQLTYAAIIRAQKIMHVTDKDEMIKELKKQKIKESSRHTEKTDSNSREEELEWSFQFAWDRHSTFLNAQSRAQTTLNGLIRQYDEMLHKNWELATEEQKMRIESLRMKLGGAGSREDEIADVLRGLVDDLDE